MTKWTIDHRRMEIIGAMNRALAEFPEIESEVFYYNASLKCAMSVEKQFLKDRVLEARK